jgi:hypothetical protein
VKPGDTFYANTTVDVTTNVTIPQGIGLRMNDYGKVRQVLLCRFTVDKQVNDTWSLTQEIESIKADTGHGGIIDAGGGMDPYQRTLRELKGARFTVTIDRRARSLKTDYDRRALFQNVVQGVYATDPSLARGILSTVDERKAPRAKRLIDVSLDDAICSAGMTTNYLLAPLFCRPLGQEEGWEQDMGVPLGPFLGVTLSGKCRFNALKAGGQKPGILPVEFRSTVIATPNMLMLNSDETQIMRARLDEDVIAGNIEFDLAAGRVKSVTSTQRLAGSIVVGSFFFGPAEYPLRQVRTVSISVTTARP